MVRIKNLKFEKTKDCKKKLRQMVTDSDAIDKKTE